MALFSRTRKPKLMVVGIDGVPRTLLLEMINTGVMPALKDLVGNREIVEQDSVLPTVSSAAWTSFMTGLYPTRHGISGFINKDEGSYDISFPRREQIRHPILPEVVSNSGGKVFSMGVPVTFPPSRINGVMISCFLAPGLDKAVWPPEELPLLRRLGYSIDPDPIVAHKNRARFMELIMSGLDRRIETIRHYFRKENWDLFIAHCMETDRLHHFFWDDYENPDAPFHNQFYEFYRKLDSLFEWIGNELDDISRLIVLSDHGFCRLDSEVNLGKWMVEQGWTRIREEKPALPLANLDWSQTRAYALIPGRVYLNLKGREKEGIVLLENRDDVLSQLRKELLEWRSPDGGTVISSVLIDDEIPGFAQDAGCPDALLIPTDGMDLKDGILRPQVFERKVLNGMHTFHNATLFLGRGEPAPGSKPWIGDLAPTILEMTGRPVPGGLDGRSLVGH